MTDTRIRPLEPPDVPAVAALADLAWRPINDQYREIYGKELFEILFPDANTRKGHEMRRICETGSHEVWVLDVDGRVAGFVSFSIDEDKKIGELGNNAVHPEYRDRGFGRKMHEAVLDHFRERGMRYAVVQTGLDPAHAPARRAYERVGFDIHREVVTYYKKL